MSIQDIRNELDAFELVKCGLRHELVKLDAETKLPLKHTSSIETQFQRIDLCSNIIRNKRLGCAHSASNVNFNRLIDALNTENTEIKTIQKKINDQILDIYALDHKKGDLEKEYAICLDKQMSTQDVDKQLKECITIHSAYIDNLKTLKTNLITSIDTLLLASNKN